MHAVQLLNKYKKITCAFPFFIISLIFSILTLITKYFHRLRHGILFTNFTSPYHSTQNLLFRHITLHRRHHQDRLRHFSQSSVVCCCSYLFHYYCVSSPSHSPHSLISHFLITSMRAPSLQLPSFYMSPPVSTTAKLSQASNSLSAEDEVDLALLLSELSYLFLPMTFCASSFIWPPFLIHRLLHYKLHFPPPNLRTSRCCYSSSWSLRRSFRKAIFQTPATP